MPVAMALCNREGIPTVPVHAVGRERGMGGNYMRKLCTVDVYTEYVSMYGVGTLYEARLFFCLFESIRL